MNIYDPLYGRYSLSEISRDLCVLPEVRRLSQIRLLNSITPTLATLSELRRYAHTLGVLHLFGLWKRTVGKRYATKDVDALEVAIILHDVATPPFGHLFEYVLKETIGWDHESAAVTTLLKAYSSASTAQQIFAGRRPKVLDYIERRGIDLELVKAILTKRHHLSKLIFGVVDFDNLDNVWRMAWSLGLPELSSGNASPEDLAAHIDIDDDGRLRLADEHVPALESWANLRRAVYNVLVFDEATVASQTILTYAIKQGLLRGLISSEDWFLHDESLLSRLSSDREIGLLIEQQYLGQLPFPITTIQIRWKAAKLFDLPRASIEEMVTDNLKEMLGEEPWVYVFKERGSFEKEVKFANEAGVERTLGATSKSLVISVFSKRLVSAHRRRLAEHAVVKLLADNDVLAEDFMRVVAQGEGRIAKSERFDF